MSSSSSLFSNQFDALAIRLPALGEEAGQLSKTRPVVFFAQQGAIGSGLDRLTVATGDNQRQAGAEDLFAGLNPFAPVGRLGRRPEKSELNRVVFIVDRSGSMGDPLLRAENESERKLAHIIRRIEGLAADYLPEGSQVSLIYFDDKASEIDLGSVKNGALAGLKQEVNQLIRGGGTDFSAPLRICRSILERDRHQASIAEGSKEPSALRSLVFFLTDGQDGLSPRIHDAAGHRDSAVALANVDSPGRLMRDIRDLNAATFVIGIGEDYSMRRIIGLAGSAGASSWSHLPMEDRALDAFDQQIPEMLRQILSCEEYFKFSVEGTFLSLATVTPTIRFADRSQPAAARLIYPGYIQQGVGIVYEQREDLKIGLIAGRDVRDRSPTRIEVPIVDSEDAIGHFEQVQIAGSLNRRMLVLRALLDGDAAVLRRLVEIHPDLQNQLDASIGELERVPRGAFDPAASHEMYSSMTQIGNASQVFSPEKIAEFKAPADQNMHGKSGKSGKRSGASKQRDRRTAGSAEHSLQLHSGHLGPLDNPSSVPDLPPADKPNARAYDGEEPVKADGAFIQIEQPVVRKIMLTPLSDEMPCMIGRYVDEAGSLGVRIADEMVSRRHCRISIFEEQYFIEDLGSKNGTRLNDSLLIQGVKRALENGDQIDLPNGWVLTFNLPQI